MDAMLPPIDNVLALVALLWLGSAILVVVCARRYFVARARDRASLPAFQEPFVDIEAAALPSTVADPIHGRFAFDDQRPAGVPPAPEMQTASSRAVLLDQIGARVLRDPESAHGLADLVRALYLDQSNFRFNAIAELDDEDRQLAKGLIDEWLADPSAVDYWQAVYAAFRVPAT